MKAHRTIFEAAPDEPLMVPVFTGWRRVEYLFGCSCCGLRRFFIFGTGGLILPIM